MKSPEKASNPEIQDQGVTDVVENPENKGQNEFFGKFLTEEEIEKEREKLSKTIKQYKGSPKKDLIDFIQDVGDKYKAAGDARKKRDLEEIEKLRESLK